MRIWSLIAMTVAVVAVSVLLAPPAARAQDAAPGSYPVTLPPHTFQAVVNYLKRQPWEDVQPLMAALAEAAQASVPQASAPQASTAQPSPPQAPNAQPAAPQPPTSESQAHTRAK